MAHFSNTEFSNLFPLNVFKNGILKFISEIELSSNSRNWISEFSNNHAFKLWLLLDPYSFKLGHCLRKNHQSKAWYGPTVIQMWHPQEITWETLCKIQRFSIPLSRENLWILQVILLHRVALEQLFRNIQVIRILWSLLLHSRTIKIVPSLVSSPQMFMDLLKHSRVMKVPKELSSRS